MEFRMFSLRHKILFSFIQEIETLDVKEVAFKVLEQLPDVTILSRGDFLVSAVRITHCTTTHIMAHYCL